MKERSLHKKGEAPEPRKRFLGRGPLVSGLLGAKLGGGHEEQVFHSIVIRETVIAFTNARDTRRRFQKKVIEAAWGIVKARAEETERTETRDENQKLLERALGKSVREYEIRPCKTTSTGSYYVITDRKTREKTTVPVGNSLMDDEDPESAMGQVLGALGVTDRKKGVKTRTLSFEVYNPPSVEGLEVSEEDLEARKLRYEGRIKEIRSERAYDSNSFTYTVEGQQTTIQAPAELRGAELLGFLEGRILGTQIAFSSGLLESLNGDIFDDIKDGDVRDVAKELYRAVWTGIDIAPSEYMEAIGGLISSGEYQELADMRKDGIVTQEEMAQFQESYRRLEGVALRSTISRRQSMQTLSATDAVLEQAMRDNPSGNERWLLRGAHRVFCDPSVSEEALRNIAEAYEQVVGGPEKDVWHFSVLIEGAGNMMTVIRKAVERFGNTVFV